MPRTDKTPPTDLETQWKRLYKSFVDRLDEQGDWTSTDAPLLELLVRTLRAAEGYRITAEQTPFSVGSQGQTIVHPAAKRQREAEQDAARYMQMLRLTPESRRRGRAGGADASGGADDGLDDVT